MSPIPITTRLHNVADTATGTRFVGATAEATVSAGVDWDLIVNGPASALFQIIHVNQYGYVTFGGHSSNAAIIYFDAPPGCPFIWAINSAEVLSIDPSKNIAFHGGPGSWNSATGAIWATNATADPTGPRNGGVFFGPNLAGDFVVLGPNGVLTTVAPLGNSGGPTTQTLDVKAPSVALSGATTTTLLSYALPNNSTAHVRGTVTFDRTDSTTDAASFEVSALVTRRASGAATLVGSPTSTAFASAGLAAATCVVDVDGANNLRVRATGVGGATVMAFGDIRVTLQAR